MKVFDSNTYAAGPLWLEGLVVIWVFALPVAACAWQLGTLAAFILTVLAVLPRLLWRPNSPPEGRAFIVANALYWNMVSPLFFGSPLFVALFVSVWPRACGSAALLYVVTVKLLVRPDLADSSAWPFFSQRDWGIRAMRQYLRLRVHVSDKLIARPAAQPVIIAIHPHGIAADFRVALEAVARGQGVVSFEALLVAVNRTVGVVDRVSVPVVESIFNAQTIPSDADGAILSELCCGLSVLCEGSKSEKLAQAFNMFDGDGDGCLTRRELWKFLRCFLKTLLCLTAAGRGMRASERRRPTSVSASPRAVVSREVMVSEPARTGGARAREICC